MGLFSFLTHKEEPAVVIEIEVSEISEEQSSSEAQSQENCAWCGDPPDANGSHGICAFHAAQMVAQARARRNG